MKYPGNNEESIPAIVGSSDLVIPVVTVLYASLAIGAYMLAMPPGNIPAIFPASGLAFAMVFLYGRPAIAGVFLGSFIVNALFLSHGTDIDLQTIMITLLTSLFVASGATATAVAGVFLVNRFGNGQSYLNGEKNVLIFVFFGALASCMVIATIGIICLSLAGNMTWNQIGFSWLAWWQSDAIGVIVTAPLILAFYRQPITPRNTWQIIEAVTIAIIIILLSLFVFFQDLRLEYWLFPLILWATVRFGIKGTTSAAAVIALIAMIATYVDYGQSETMTPENQLIMYSLLAVAIVCGLLLAGVQTEHQRSKEALQLSETKFRTLFQASSDAVMLLTRNGFFDCNPATLKIFGCTTIEEFCAKHPSDLSPPTQPNGTDSIIQSIKMIEIAMESGSNRFEWVHKRAHNGELFPAEVLLSKMTFNGNPVLQASVRDITDRKQAEEALHDKDTLLANIASQVPGMLFLFKMKPDGKLSYPYCSEGVRELFGCSPEELKNTFDPIFNTIIPEDRHKILQAIEESSKILKPWMCEYRVQQSGKPVKWILCNSMPEKKEDGSIVWAGYNSDITERKKNENMEII